MPITRFDDGGLGIKLKGYWNAAESDITLDEFGNVASIASPADYGLSQTLVKVGASPISVGGKIGELTAFSDVTSDDNEQALEWTPTAPIPYGEGLCVVVVEQRAALTSSGQKSWDAIRDNGTVRAGVDAVNAGVYRTYQGYNIHNLTGISATLDPTIQVYNWGGAANSLTVTVKNDGGTFSETVTDDLVTPNDLVKFGFMGAASAPAKGINGRMSMMLVYEELEAGEVTDVIDLCQAWIDTGYGAVPPVYDTFTTFGPVLTEDLDAVLKWQWNSVDGETGWHDVDDEINPLDDSIAYVEDSVDVGGTTQTNNQLNIEWATAEQVVYFRCKATTPYTPDGIFSNVHTLTVVEAV